MNRMAQTSPPRGVNSFGREQSRDVSGGRVIPYEYVADFTLTGEVGNLVQDVINVSVEGVFVAVSIGYALAEERAEKPSGESVGQGAFPTLGNVRLGDLPPDALLDGFRLNPNLRQLIAPDGRLIDTLPFRPEMVQRLKPVNNF